MYQVMYHRSLEPRRLPNTQILWLCNRTDGYQSTLVSQPFAQVYKVRQLQSRLDSGGSSFPASQLLNRASWFIRINLNDCTGLPGITGANQSLGLPMGMYPPTHFPSSSVAAHDKSIIVLRTIFPSSDSTDKAFSPDIFTVELEFKMISLTNTSRATPYFHSRESPS